MPTSKKINFGSGDMMTLPEKVAQLKKQYDTVSEILNALDSDLEKLYFIDQQINSNRTNQAILCATGHRDLAISIQETIDYLNQQKREIYGVQHG